MTILPGANMQPWSQTSRGSPGGSMGFDLSGYTNRPNPRSDNRSYGPSYVADPRTTAANAGRAAGQGGAVVFGNVQRLAAQGARPIMGPAGIAGWRM